MLLHTGQRAAGIFCVHTNSTPDGRKVVGWIINVYTVSLNTKAVYGCAGIAANGYLTTEEELTRSFQRLPRALLRG